jgi:guanine deaminase
MSDEHWMRIAIAEALKGIDVGQTPFGAAIVRDGQIVVAAHNLVWKTTDSTAHAEVVAIRNACAISHTIDLRDCTIYSTCEPCPMCFSACHWAKIRRIVYGASIADAAGAGFCELTIGNAEMKRLGNADLEIVGGVLREECRALFDLWRRSPDRRAY